MNPSKRACPTLPDLAPGNVKHTLSTLPLAPTLEGRGQGQVRGPIDHLSAVPLRGEVITCSTCNETMADYVIDVHRVLRHTPPHEEQQ